MPLLLVIIINSLLLSYCPVISIPLYLTNSSSAWILILLWPSFVYGYIGLSYSPYGIIDTYKYKSNLTRSNTDISILTFLSPSVPAPLSLSLTHVLKA